MILSFPAKQTSDTAWNKLLVLCNSFRSLKICPNSAIPLTATVFILGACAVPTGTISDKTLSEWSDNNLPRVFQEQDPLANALSISEAVARSLRYNLQKRVATLQEELAVAEARIETYNIFPSLVTGYRINGRNNPPIAHTKDFITGRQNDGRTYATEIYPYKTDFDVQTSWNLLNMGVAVVRARQATDRAKIATERRRKAVQEIINEVQISFWQAAAAQRLSGDVERLLPRVDEAIALRRREENSGVRPPLESLAEQRTLLELKRQLLAIHNSLVNAKATLANLIGVRPGTDFKLNLEDGSGLPNIELGIDALERYGLNNRPELIEEAYAERIAHHDVIAAVMSTLPSISIEAGYNLTTDDLIKNKTWANYGAQLTYNLVNVAKGINATLAAQKRQTLVKQRRLAVAMSVLTQIRLSWLNYWQAREQYQAAVDFANVENRILQNVQSLSSSGTVGELELIRAYMNALIGELNKDLAFADLRAALNRLLISTGADPSPESVLSSSSLDDFSQEITLSLANWQHTMLANLHWQDAQASDALTQVLSSPAGDNAALSASVANPWRPSRKINNLLTGESAYSWQFVPIDISIKEKDIPLAPVSAITHQPLQLVYP